MNMPFQFPDPSVQSRITHPDTGEVWVHEDGVWQIEEPEATPSPVTCSEPTPTPCSSPPDGVPNAEIAALRAEINLLQTDIINLRAQLTAATINNFLILE